MKKYLRWLISLAVIGSVIGLIIAYFCKDSGCDGCCDDSQDLAEEDDFDLDSDLEPVADREYVPLKRAAESTSDTEAEEAVSPEKGADKAPAEEKE